MEFSMPFKLRLSTLAGSTHEDYLPFVNRHRKKVKHAVFALPPL